MGLVEGGHCCSSTKEVTSSLLIETHVLKIMNTPKTIDFWKGLLVELIFLKCPAHNVTYKAKLSHSTTGPHASWRNCVCFV